MKILLIITLVLAALTSAQVEGTPPWSLALSLGGILTSGNTELVQVDGELEVSRVLTGPEFTAGILASASYGRQGGMQFLERYLTLLNLRYEFSDKTYSTADGRWYRNEFIGIRDEFRISVGIGHTVLSSERLLVSTGAGIGMYNRRSTSGERLETPLGYAGVEAELSLSESFFITETAYINTDLKDLGNYYLESHSEVTSSISGNLSLVLGYDVISFTVPPVEGMKATDTTLRLLLRFTM